ncbi:helix-turn-helix transcriptional regulator [bacterium]|nr:helix-turn-helix transcriptional regulator [bacterium]
MNSNKKLLGKRIKEIRKQKGFTQETLSERVNIDITTLSGIESGRHFPSLVTLEKIANILHVPLVALFDFNHLVSIQEMKTVIYNNINILTDDDIKLIYNIISKKYL